MKRRLAAALMMLSLSAPLAAAAQGYPPHGQGRGGDRGGYGERGEYGGPGGFGERGGGPYERGGYGGEFDERRDEYRGLGPGPEGPRGRNPPELYRGPRLPGPFVGRGPYGGVPGHKGWSRGQYLPPAARGEMIQDFQRYHLRRPPRGYYWYRAGDDYVLAAVASGVIFEVIRGDGY